MLGEANVTLDTIDKILTNMGEPLDKVLAVMEQITLRERGK